MPRSKSCWANLEFQECPFEQGPLDVSVHDERGGIVQICFPTAFAVVEKLSSCRSVGTYWRLGANESASIVDFRGLLQNSSRINGAETKLLDCVYLISENDIISLMYPIRSQFLKGITSFATGPLESPSEARLARW